MRRVLMISPHFPPDSTAATHRVRLIAPHLRCFGWEPTVLTVDPRDYEGRLDPVLADSVPTHLRVVRARAWPASATRPFGFGDLGLRAFAGLRRAAHRLLDAERFDAIFITIYPTYPALLGPWLKARFGLPFILDYQDPWTGEWGRTVGGGRDGRPDLRSRATRLAASRLEPVALQRADAVTAVSRLTYEHALSRLDGERPPIAEELPVGWDRADFDFLREKRSRRVDRFERDGRLHVVYVGTLLPNGLDTLRAVLKAVAEVRRNGAGAHLRLHFFGTSNQRTTDAAPRVLPIAHELGLAEVVSEHPARLDYFDALEVLVQSDAVLLLGSHEYHYTPSKAYPAIASERPIVAALHEASTAASLLQRIGRAPAVRLVTYDDRCPALANVVALQSALADFIADPSYRRDDVDWRLLESSSASALAARLAGVFDRTLQRQAA